MRCPLLAGQQMIASLWRPTDPLVGALPLSACPRQLSDLEANILGAADATLQAFAKAGLRIRSSVGHQYSTACVLGDVKIAQIKFNGHAPKAQHVHKSAARSQRTRVRRFRTLDPTLLLLTFFVHLRLCSPPTRTHKHTPAQAHALREGVVRAAFAAARMLPYLL